MDDEQLMAMKTNGGVVQINAVASFIKADPPQRGPAIESLRQEFGLTNGRGGAGAPQTTSSRRCPVEGSAAPAAGGGRGRGGNGPEALSAGRAPGVERPRGGLHREGPPAGPATGPGSVR